MINKYFEKKIIHFISFLRYLTISYRYHPIYQRISKMIKSNTFLFDHLREKQPLAGRTVMFAITNDCFCHCKNCGCLWERKTRKNEKTLEDKEIFSLIDDIQRLGGSDIYFFGGEPLTHKNIDAFIRHAKKKGFYTRMDTNGILLSEERAKELGEAGLDMVGVAIDSAVEENHDRSKGVPGAFKKAVSGIKFCKQEGMDCYISTYATKDSIKSSDFENIIGLGKSLGVKTRYLSAIASGKWFAKDEIILSESERKILGNLREAGSVFWEESDNKDEPFFCPALTKRFFYLSAYGDVQPCCYFRLNFGNVRQNSLESIIKKMWKEELYEVDDFPDCPSNNKNIRDKYHHFLSTGKEYNKEV